MRRAVRYRLGGQDSSSTCSSGVGSSSAAITLSPLAVETRLLRLPPSSGASAGTASSSFSSSSKLLPSFLLLGGGRGTNADDDEEEGEAAGAEGGLSGGGKTSMIKRRLALRTPQPLAAFGLWDGEAAGPAGVRLRCVLWGGWMDGWMKTITHSIPAQHRHKSHATNPINQCRAYRDPSTVLHDLRSNARALLLASTDVEADKQRVRLPLAVRRYWEVRHATRCDALR